MCVSWLIFKKNLLFLFLYFYVYDVYNQELLKNNFAVLCTVTIKCLESLNLYTTMRIPLSMNDSYTAVLIIVAQFELT